MMYIKCKYHGDKEIDAEPKPGCAVGVCCTSAKLFMCVDFARSVFFCCPEFSDKLEEKLIFSCFSNHTDNDGYYFSCDNGKGTIGVKLKYCPFCGKKLEASYGK